MLNDWTFSYSGSATGAEAAISNDPNLDPKAQTFLSEFVEVASTALPPASHVFVSATQKVLFPTNQNAIVSCAINTYVEMNCQAASGNWSFIYSGDPETGKTQLSTQRIENYARWALQNYFDQAVMSKGTQCTMSSSQTAAPQKTVIKVAFTFN